LYAFTIFSPISAKLFTSLLANISTASESLLNDIIILAVVSAGNSGQVGIVGATVCVELPIIVPVLKATTPTNAVVVAAYDVYSRKNKEVNTGCKMTLIERVGR